MQLVRRSYSAADELKKEKLGFSQLSSLYEEYCESFPDEVAKDIQATTPSSVKTHLKKSSLVEFVKNPKLNHLMKLHPKQLTEKLSELCTQDESGWEGVLEHYAPSFFVLLFSADLNLESILESKSPEFLSKMRVKVLSLLWSIVFSVDVSDPLVQSRLTLFFQLCENKMAKVDECKEAKLTLKNISPSEVVVSDIALQKAAFLKGEIMNILSRSFGDTNRRFQLLSRVQNVLAFETAQLTKDKRYLKYREDVVQDLRKKP